MVTAAAALDTGKATPDSTFDGSSPQTISGSPLSNFGGESFGPVSFTESLTNSVNTVFARVGERVGRRTLVRYMDRFGFGQDPPLDYPSDQMIPSGVVAKGRVVGGEQAFDVGRVAIGQGGLEGQILATPLQMAMVASAVGPSWWSAWSPRTDGSPTAASPSSSRGSCPRSPRASSAT